MNILEASNVTFFKFAENAERHGQAQLAEAMQEEAKFVVDTQIHKVTKDAFYVARYAARTYNTWDQKNRPPGSMRLTPPNYETGEGEMSAIKQVHTIFDTNGKEVFLFNPLEETQDLITGTNFDHIRLRTRNTRGTVIIFAEDQRTTPQEALNTISRVRMFPPHRTS